MFLTIWREHFNLRQVKRNALQKHEHVAHNDILNCFSISILMRKSQKKKKTTKKTPWHYVQKRWFSELGKAIWIWKLAGMKALSTSWRIAKAWLARLAWMLCCSGRSEKSIVMHEKSCWLLLEMLRVESCFIWNELNSRCSCFAGRRGNLSFLCCQLPLLSCRQLTFTESEKFCLGNWHHIEGVFAAKYGHVHAVGFEVHWLRNQWEFLSAMNQWRTRPCGRRFSIDHPIYHVLQPKHQDSEHRWGVWHQFFHTNNCCDPVISGLATNVAKYGRNWLWICLFWWSCVIMIRFLQWLQLAAAVHVRSWYLRQRSASLWPLTSHRDTRLALLLPLVGLQWRPFCGSAPRVIQPVYWPDLCVMQFEKFHARALVLVSFPMSLLHFLVCSEGMRVFLGSERGQCCDVCFTLYQFCTRISHLPRFPLPRMSLKFRTKSMSILFKQCRSAMSISIGCLGSLMAPRRKKPVFSSCESSCGRPILKWCAFCVNKCSKLSITAQEIGFFLRVLPICRLLFRRYIIHN